MIFVFKSAITLALLYSCFFAFLSKETFHRFNRIMLVGIMVAALTIPFLQLTTDTPTIINEGLHDIEQDFTYAVISTQGVTETAEQFDWVDYAIIIYLIGVAVMVCLTVIESVTLLCYLRSGLRHTDSYGNTIILKTNDTAPFSILKYIVMSVNDYETNRTYILTHEQEHIRLGHTYDILLLAVMQILQWFNPFIWFLGRDLRAVHEFEADQAVLNKGIDAKAYQTLLVTKTVGVRLQPLANNLNHNSLKRRIIMMYHKKSSRWMMLKALCAIPVAALAVTAFARPMTIEKMEQAITTAEKKVTTTVKRTVEERISPTVQEHVERHKDTTRVAMSKKVAEPEAEVETEVEEGAKVITSPSHTPTGIPIYQKMPEYTGHSSTANGVTIKRTKDCTYVTLIGTCNYDVGKFKVGGKENLTFIEDVATGDHYKLRCVKDDVVPIGGEGFYVIGMRGKRWAVTLVFPPLPDDVKRIKFWHLDSWTGSANRILNIKDIEEI